jgi:uncharacterized membrane protein
MSIFKWIKEKSQQFFNSIALIPAVVVFIFLLFSAAMIYLDYSDTGKELKANIGWIRLKDSSTARTIVSVIAAGLISITVFSFSMVMVVLNQAASQLSNRVIDRLIGNRLQQFILGFYIGTIIYSLLLLSSIRDIESGIFVPALSTYMLIFLSVVAIFLFVFFLHFITQSIKYAVIIQRIFTETQTSLEHSCRLSDEPVMVPIKVGLPVPAYKSGIFESFNSKQLVSLLKEQNCTVSFRFSPGQFVLKGIPLCFISHQQGKIPDELIENINEHIYIVEEESIQRNFYFGFRQLAEVAIKALSPGINDPGTAIESIRALVKLLAYRLHHFPDNTICGTDCVVRIITTEKSFEQIVDNTLLPVWDYGYKDRFVQNELKGLLLQLQSLQDNYVIKKFLIKVQAEINKLEA